MADVTLTAAFEGLGAISKAFDDIGAAFTDAEKRSALLSKSAFALGAAIGGAVTAAIAASAAFINTADELSKTSQKVGVTTEELSALKYAADLSGVSFDQLKTGLVKFSANIGDAANGTGTARTALDNLGISLADSSGYLKSNTVLMNEVADAFASMPDGIQKTSAAVDIFGKAGADMIPLLNGGSKGLADMAAEAKEFGVIIDSEAAKSAEAFNDNISRLKGLFASVVSTAFQPTISTMAEMSSEFIVAVRESGALESAVSGLQVVFKSVVTAAIVVTNTIRGLVEIITTAAKTAYLVAKGEFAAAWQTINTGVSNVAANSEKAFADIERVWASTNKKVEDSGKKTTDVIVKSTKQSQKEIEAAVKTRGEREVAEAEKINAAWAEYYKNLDINSAAAFNKAEKEADEYAKKQVALSEELNDAWAAYYDALRENENAKKTHADSITKSLKLGWGNYLQWAKNSSSNIYAQIASALTDTLQRGTASFSNAVADWVVTGKSIDWKSIWELMATSFISSLVMMGVQMVVFKTLGVLGFTAVGTTGVATGVAVNVAWAPVTATILAIAAAVAVVIAVMEDWNSENLWITKIIKAHLQPIIWMFEKIKALIEYIVDAWGKIKSFGGKLGGFVGDAWGSFKGMFATGGSFVTNGPSLFVAGENGRERVTIGAPTSSQSSGGGGVTNVYKGPVILDQVTMRRFVRMQLEYARNERQV